MTATTPNAFADQLRSISDALADADCSALVEVGAAIDAATDQLDVLADLAEAHPWTGTADLDLAAVPT